MGESITYELDELATIVHRLGDDLTNSDSSLQEPDLFVRKLRQESERIKKRLISEVFTFQDERHLERYIQFHQQGLVQLIDDLVALRTVHEPTDKTLSLIPEVINISIYQIEDLLEFIEKYFSKYFDLDARAPKSYVHLATIEAVKHHINLQTILDQKIEKYLMDLALKPLKSFIESSESKHITYRAIIYVRDVQKEINKLVASNPNDKDLEEKVRTMLVYLNYNTLSYFRYFVDNFQSQLLGLTSSSLLQRLSYLLKTINQLQTRPGAYYNSKVPSLKEQLVNWIVEETAFQERAFFLREKNGQEDHEIKYNFKLKTELSVSQLAFMLKLFIETKVIKNTNTSELIRFFARSFQTNRQENISYESLRVRFYNTESTTRKSIRSILLQMVDFINKD